MKFTSIFLKASALYFRGLPQKYKSKPTFHKIIRLFIDAPYEN